MLKSIRYLFISFLFLLTFVPVIRIHASGQSCDLLIIGSDTVCIFSNPLYSKLNNGHYDIPCTEHESYLSNCERGYIATWQIENDSLFLVQLISCGLTIDSCLGNKSLLELMFGSELKKGRLYAAWYSNKIIIPQGRIIRYVHMGYGSIYESESHINFCDGKLTDSLSFTNYLDTPEGLNRYEKLDASFSIYEHIKKNFNWQLVPDTPTWIMRFNITISTNGQIGCIENLDEESDIYREALSEALNSINTFDIIKVRGVPIEETFRFGFEFNTVDKLIREPNIDYEIKRRKRESL